MDSVLRAAAVYVFVMVVFRIAGTRTLSQITAFDFVLLLIIGNATQQALLGYDYSVTNSFVVVATLLGLDITVSVLKKRFETFERVVDGLPTILIHNGQINEEAMAKSRLDESDILHAARQLQGLERVDQIKHAVLEISGGITVIPKPEAKAGS